MEQKPDPFRMAAGLDSRFVEISEVELKNLEQKLMEAEEIVRQIRLLCDAGWTEAVALEQLF